MKIRLAGPIQSDSIVDGEGIRTVIWTQGCIHNCYGCHNPETHSFEAGTLVDTDDVIKILDNLKGQDGITLSGGDPMCQVDACLVIARHAKKIGLNVWCYTGYTFDKDVMQDMCNKWEETPEILSYLDVVVDGKFEEDKKDLKLQFRGSSNQRILDVKETLRTGTLQKEDKYI